MSEAFKPIAVKPPSANRLLFWIRCRVDLQLLTIYDFLRPALNLVRGSLLDVGAGEAPWRELLHPAVTYIAVDVESAAEFGMAKHLETHYYDGTTLPFVDARFESVLCTEVLEHVPDAAKFLAELNRVLTPNGLLILTVPWSARIHHVPHDYARYTRYGLLTFLQAAGFSQVEIVPRGNDVAAIANKLIVIAASLLRPRHALNCLLTWPAAIAISPMALTFVILAHLTIALDLGSQDDPLGYGVLARKSP